MDWHLIPADKRPRRSLAATMVTLAVLTGCGRVATPPAAPPPSASASVSTTMATPSPAVLTMPNVVGLNAAVAVDRLKKLGFTNIDLGTVDGRAAVVLPQNWTVRTQSAQPGDHLAKDDKIVLGCARNG